MTARPDSAREDPSDAPTLLRDGLAGTPGGAAEPAPAAQVAGGTVTTQDKLTELHNRMIELTRDGRLEWVGGLDGYQWSSPHHSLIVKDEMISIYDSFGRKLAEGAHPLTADLFAAAASSHDQRAARLIEALIADLDARGQEA